MSAISESETERLERIARDRGLPPPPRRPAKAECCDRRCDPCIWDYYHRAIGRWRERHAIEESAARAGRGEGGP